MTKFVMITTFYPPYHIGGDAMHVYHLSNELAKLGHKVSIIHSIEAYHLKRKGKPSYNYPNHENITIHSIKSPIGKLSPIITYIFGTLSPLEDHIKTIIKNVEPDVIHHHNISGFGPFIFDLTAPNVIYTAHDYWLACPLSGLMQYNGEFCNGRCNCFACSLLSKRPPQLWRYIGLLNRKIKNIDKIITPSEYMKKKLQELGIKGDFKIMHNFIPDPPKIGPPLYDFPYFLFVGSLERHKGILNLIEEFISVKDIVDIKLLIVGSGSLEKIIRHIIVNSSEKIVMLGRIDESSLANVYANAIAVIIPSIWPENCPLVALEAIANKTPIIVSNKGGLPELIRMSGAGITMSNNFPISHFLKDITGIRTLSESVKNNHNRYFTSQEYIKNYLELIKNR